MRLAAVCTAIVVLVLLAVDAVGVAQASYQTGRWAPVERVPGYAPGSHAPYLVADQNRTVHAFNHQIVVDTVAVVYRRWSLAEGWTEPIDVLLSPQGGQARVCGAYLDNKGALHVVFFGGDDLNFGVYYSQAPAAIADRATSWSKPVRVGANAGPLSDATIVGDGKGSLFILYAGRQAGVGIYSVTSSDEGVTWSEPSALYLTPGLRQMTSGLKALFDSKGRLHAVWVVNNSAGNGIAVYHARLAADRATWTRPVALAMQTGRQIAEGTMAIATADIPSLVEHNGELLVVYFLSRLVDANNTEPALWLRRSNDGGNSWSAPARAFEGWFGANGPVSLVHDGANALHAIFGNRTGDRPATHGMWHSVWQGNRWGPIEAIVSGRQVNSAEGFEFDPYAPRTVVSQGNVLLATWVTDPGAGPNGVWHSHIVLNTPERPVVSLPTPAPSPTVAASPTATPQPLPTRVPVLSSPAPLDTELREESAAPPDAAQGWHWAAGVVPVIVLVSAVMAASMWSGRREG